MKFIKTAIVMVAASAGWILVADAVIRTLATGDAQ